MTRRGAPCPSGSETAQAVGVTLASLPGGSAATLAITGGIAVSLWLALLAILAAASRTRQPTPAPAAMELGGPESPAVANFLANSCKVSRAALPATLLDLAARKVISLERVAPEQYIVRLGAAPPTQLTPYERRVYDHVRSVAVDGEVPCEALTTGPDEQSKAWWEGFEKQVVAEARDRGLARSRWAPGVLALLGVAALAPAGLLTAAAAVAVNNSNVAHGTASSQRHGGAAALLVPLLVWLVLMAIAYSLRAERETTAGEAAAARWLGLQEYLQRDPAFAEQPPTAVAIWDRFLAYGAALGVAAGAVRPVALGSESAHEAWSSYGGRWRVVRIRYPRWIPPAWGQAPAGAAAKALVLLVVAVLAGGGIGRTLVHALSSVAGDLSANGLGAIEVVGLFVFGFMALVIAGAMARAVLVLGFAISDLFGRRDVEGRVLRVRKGQGTYLAVDDGTRSQIRAWLVDSGTNGASQGALVRATISPHLAHVYKLEEVAE
jgi:Predicted membrane protein (DUF2207)